MTPNQVQSLEEKLQDLLKGYSFSAVLSSLTDIADQNADYFQFIHDGPQRKSQARGRSYHKLSCALDVAFKSAEGEGL